MTDNNFFDPDAEAVFKKANVLKTEAPEMFEEVKNILSHKMATLSATMGLSYKRLDLYDEQKKALIDDLVKLKEEKSLR